MGNTFTRYHESIKVKGCTCVFFSHTSYLTLTAGDLHCRYTEKHTMTSKEFITALEEIGYEPTAYAGRGMCGRYCVGISVDRGSAFNLGYELAASSPDPDGAYPGAPNSDAMGMGVVLYWPNFEWPADKVTE